MNKNFAMMVLQTISRRWAEASPPPSVNITNELQPFGHRRGKNFDAPEVIRTCLTTRRKAQKLSFCRANGVF